MFDMESLPTIVKSVVESADSGIGSANSTADSAANPLKIGLWVRAFISEQNNRVELRVCIVSVPTKASSEVKL